MPEHAQARGTPSPSAGAPRRRRLVAALAPLSAALLLVALAVALFGGRLFGGVFGGPPAFELPAGWHDVTAPTSETIASETIASETIASETIASYTVSPDVPGLILACIGEKAGRLSADPMGPAGLWRSRDGGARWERLPSPSLLAGCAMATPLGGRGTFFIFEELAAGQPIRVSHDAGDTWRALNPRWFGGMRDPHALFQSLAGAMYRDGTLYSFGSDAPTAFISSTDNGATWANPSSAPDPPLDEGFLTLGIAPDYRAPGAWFRLLDPPWNVSVNEKLRAILEHSDDGGRTWASLGPLGPVGHSLGGGLRVLATTPERPSRLCVMIAAEVTGNTPSAPPRAGGARTSAPAGPPAPTPTDVALFGSDDGGLTFGGGTIAQHRREYGGPVSPGPAIGPNGDCYLAEDASDLQTTTTTFWRLPAGAGTTNTVVRRLSGVVIYTFALGPIPAGQPPHLYAVATMAEPFKRNICDADAPCYDLPRQTPHLIWTAAR